MNRFDPKKELENIRREADEIVGRHRLKRVLLIWLILAVLFGSIFIYMNSPLKENTINQNEQILEIKDTTEKYVKFNLIRNEYKLLKEANPQANYEIDPEVGGQYCTSDSSILITINTDQSAVLSFKDSGRIEKPLLLERYRWNKYQTIDTLNQLEQKFKWMDYHGGLNEFYISQNDVPIAYIGISGYSEITQYPEILSGKRIPLTRITAMEVFDDSGNCVLRDTNNELIISELKKGLYYWNYDNINEELIKY